MTVASSPGLIPAAFDQPVRRAKQWTGCTEIRSSFPSPQFVFVLRQACPLEACFRTGNACTAMASQSPPHRVGGQRRYSSDALDRVLLIRFDTKVFLNGLKSDAPV